MSAAAVIAAVAALCGAFALRDAVRSWPRARAWVEAAFEPLARAGSEGYEPTDGERRRLWLLASAAAAVTLTAVVGPGPYLALLGVVPLASDRLIAARRSRYRAAVQHGLGPWARALGDAVAAGQPVRAALIGSVDAAPVPVNRELLRVCADLEAGAGLDLALSRLCERIGSRELDSIASALVIAARSGGDVGPLLRRFAAANDERVAVLADARSATAQARMTGLVVAAMPAAGLLFAELSSPGFASAMISDPAARVILLVSLLMQAGAFAVIRRISQVRA